MGQLMVALVKYADSDSTKDPASDEEKTGKGKKNGNADFVQGSFLLVFYAFGQSRGIYG